MTTVELVAAMILIFIGAVLVSTMVVFIIFVLQILRALLALRAKVATLGGPARKLRRRVTDTIAIVKAGGTHLRDDARAVRDDVRQQVGATKALYRDAVVLPVIATVRGWWRRIREREPVSRQAVVFTPAEEPTLYIVRPRRTREPVARRRAA